MGSALPSLRGGRDRAKELEQLPSFLVPVGLEEVEESRVLLLVLGSKILMRMIMMPNS